MTIKEFRKIVPPENFARLMDLIASGAITQATAKYVLREMVESGIKTQEMVVSSGGTDANNQTTV